MRYQSKAFRAAATLTGVLVISSLLPAMAWAEDTTTLTQSSETATSASPASTTVTAPLETTDTATSDTAEKGQQATTPTTPDATTPDTATTPTTPDSTTSDTATTPDATTPDGATTPDDATTADKATTSEKATTPDKATTQATTTEAATTAQAATTQAATTVTTQAYRNQWVQEGSRWYYYDASGSRASGWVVNSTFKTYGLQRYWLDTTTKALASSELVKASEAGYWAYATRYGYVVRGRYTEGGVTYLADNDGRLESPGWHVSSAYGQGLQRYYVTAAKHGCVTGYSTAGWAHYTTPAGYVLRGAATCADGARRIADNDGRVQASGWLVTSAFGQGLQRYWLSGGSVAASRLVSPSEGAGYWAYATSAGYVLRGHLTSGTVTYLADNDGRLANSEGWHVSSAYGQGLQRYYVSAAKHGCVTGYSAAGWAHYTTPAGYVARGAYDTGAGRVYVANNDGRLAWGTSTGWVVQNYGSGLQRYYVSASDHGACSGFFSVAGYGRCFGVGGAGYVMRGKMGWGSTVLLADNEGKLATQSGWLVTGAYDGGTLQRYYMVNAWSDYKGARTGWFTVSGSNFYGRNTVGYVARNGYIQHNGSWYQADNDGKLTRVTSGKIGWQNPSWMYQVSCYNASLPSYAEGYFTYVTPSRIAINASRQDCVNAFMGRAYDYLGSPYIWDYAMQPGVGVDCAGLVIQCLYAVGINSVYNPYDHMYDPWQDHDATNMYNDSKFEHVSISNISYGDLVFYSGHIAIYIGNGQVINATSPSEGVVINSVYRFSIIGVGRVFA